jgi:hypothetical protein
MSTQPEKSGQEAVASSELFDILYFGWSYPSGHTLHSRVRHLRYDSTPWGNDLDTGLLKDLPDNPDGRYVIEQRDGWTAIAFWDRSGDSRPNSNTAFLVAAIMPGNHLLELARKQWPEIFARRGFPLSND